MQSHQKTKRIVFIQDAIDPDNLASSVAVAKMAAQMAKSEDTILLDVIVSTAERDLGRPRFSPAPTKFGGHQEALSGNMAPNGKKLLANSKGNLLDNTAMQDYDAELLSSVILPEISNTNVKLRMIPDKITRSGLWEPLLPLTHLMKKAYQESIQEKNPISMVASYKNMIKVMESDVPSEAYQEESGSTIYQANYDPDKDARAAKYRQHMNKFNQWTSRKDALDDIVTGAANGEEIIMILCAPIGFAVSLLRKLSTNGLTQSVKQVWGDLLTLNPQDNLVGFQWNEYLDLKSAHFVLRFLQEKKIPTFLLPTQVFKATKTMNSVFEKVHQKALATAPAEMSTPLYHQLLWNVLKANPPVAPGKAQPIFDPLVVYWMMNPDKIKTKQVRLVQVSFEYDNNYSIVDDPNGCFSIPDVGRYAINGKYMEKTPSDPFVDPEHVHEFYLSCYEKSPDVSCNCCQATKSIQENSTLTSLIENATILAKNPFVIAGIALAIVNIVAAAPALTRSPWVCFF